MFDESEEFEEFEESDEFDEAEPDDPEFAEPEPVFAVPLPDELPDDELFVCEAVPVEPAVVWVEPGSTAATAPAATTLAKLTVTVAAFSLRRPRSRSATARAMLRPP